MTVEERTIVIDGMTISLRWQGLGNEEFVLTICGADKIPSNELVQEFSSEVSALDGFALAVDRYTRLLQRRIELRAVRIYMALGRKGLGMQWNELRSLSVLMDPALFLNASLDEAPLLLQRFQVERAAIDAGIPTPLAEGSL